jgi:hypothetical protein
MENDIEQELKQSADKIVIKDFSKKWSDINSKCKNVQTDTNSDLQTAPVTNVGTLDRSTGRKKLLIIVCTAIAFLIALSITLPLVLTNKSNLSQTNEENKTKITIESLTYCPVVESVFYQRLKDENVDIVDLSAYNAADYLLCTYGETLKGGAIFFKENDITYLTVSFFDYSVEITEEYTLQYNANDVAVYYDTQVVENGFETNAYAEYNNLKYLIYYFSEENDCTKIFNEIF